jgi:hypothetical protein
MAQIPKLIDHIQDLLTSDPTLAANGITKKNVYRRYLPMVKNPPAPHITLHYEVERTGVATGIDKVKVYIILHTSEFLETYEMQVVIHDIIHRLTYADENFVLYKCFSLGGPAVPFFDKELNHWECCLEFDCEVG